MHRLMPIWIASLAVLAVGLTLGLRSGRWSPRPPLAEVMDMADRELVPRTVGDWAGIDLPRDPRELEVARASWELTREYRRPGDPGSITVMILGGGAGPMSVHTPDVCFVGGGQVQVDPAPRSIALESVNGEPAATFRAARFASSGATRLALWAWSDGENWCAPDYPRIHFASAPGLFKVYVIRAGESVPSDPDALPALDPATLEFLRTLLPQLDRALFGTPDSPPPPAGSETGLRRDPQADHSPTRSLQPPFPGVDPR